ncbi:MAG: redoxin domain-containing protein [Planctomycetaceae bacterium]|nr:redoxin domain-containing protein [Planctomycetaceae bacterium]MBT6157364.1 redoxin domain-containing protein [Planctomycetaceae bacterium]MBT6483472.1 redoxin domain-containing protein [Planctomycetaceae bacterium]MBT6497092.1 redoxin domain-containing protein [Planctomycetaceae bacterium]
MIRTMFLLAALSAVWFSGETTAQADEAKVKVGDAAPTFTLKDANGKQTSLKTLLRKKPVALVFHRSADW